MDIDKEDVVQAVVIMDTFNNHFNPICNDKPVSMLQVAGVRLIDYLLESLSRGGVGEAILFCCQDGPKIKDYIKKCTQEKVIWSMSMDVQVMMSDTCQTMGDVMREIDAAGLVRGCFILTSVTTITNINFASLLEQHKQLFKKDKGAAMTLVYKKLSWEHPLIRSDKPVFLAADARTNKVLMHQKYKIKSKDKSINLPLEIVLNHSEVKLHHNLADANIALCSPSVPPLFADNFDFQTRDDFIHGILINEEILASSLNYLLLKDNQYAAAVTNWKTYQIVSRDVLHMWAYPLTINTGSFSQNNYLTMGDLHNFRDKTSNLSRSCSLVEDVLIGFKTQINDNTILSKSMIGKNCVVGNSVTIKGSHVMDNVTIKDNCSIINSFIDDNAVIGENTTINNGSIVGANVKVDAGSELKGNVLESSEVDNENAHLKKSTSETTEWENESSGTDVDDFIGFEKNFSDSESCYSSDGSDNSSLPESPIPEDTNIFLQEVIDSLARGYEEKLKCDYLILEINSSRYAYNIQLHEVNFFVVRALLSMPVLEQNKNVLATVKNIFKYFQPVLINYIKSKSSRMDCLKAVEESCIYNECLEGKAGQIVHLLYESDVVDEDALLHWRKELIANESVIAQQTSLVKFFEWLEEASEESDSD